MYSREQSVGRGLILNLSCMKPQTFQEARTYTYILEKTISEQICNSCMEMNTPFENICVNYVKVCQQRDNYDISEMLNDSIIYQLAQSVKNYVDPILMGYLMNRENLSNEHVLNFSLAIMHFSSIIITYEVYQK